MGNERGYTFSKQIQVAVVGSLAALFLNLLGKTIRWRLVGAAADMKQFGSEGPYILAFWHGQQLMMPYAYRMMTQQARRKGAPMPSIITMISSHADGRIISKAISFFGIGTVTGSSSKGGKEAAQISVESLKQGLSLAITPDGPRGPSGVAKPGVAKIASLTGVKVRGMGAAASRYWQFKSWDKMILPKPFSTVVVSLDDGLFVPPGLAGEEGEHYIRLIAERMNSTITHAEQCLQASS